MRAHGMLDHDQGLFMSPGLSLLAIKAPRNDVPAPCKDTRQVASSNFGWLGKGRRLEGVVDQASGGSSRSCADVGVGARVQATLESRRGHTRAELPNSHHRLIVQPCPTVPLPAQS